MPESFQAVRVTDRVFWVGAVDWTVRNFHGYLTSHGTTYNAYLVAGDKPALIDTVKSPFQGEMLERIASVMDPRSVHTFVSNHAEMDHSGCMPQVIDALKPEKVVASVMGVKALKEHFPSLEGLDEVKDGETLSLGNMTLSFHETCMLHWPDSMFTFLPEEGVLFSNDAFGMHLATSERFADEVQDSLLVAEGAKYYANILLPMSRLVQKLFEKVEKLDLSMGIIAPDHGPIWRRNPEKILALWKEWAAQTRGRKAVIVYDTMWGSTKKLAGALADGLASQGSPVKLMELGPSHRSDVATEILDAGALIVGSPTLNNNLFPTVADVLTYLKGLKPSGLAGASFGSFGWSGEAVGQIGDILASMKAEPLAEGFRVKYVPEPGDLARARELGAEMARALGENTGA